MSDEKVYSPLSQEDIDIIAAKSKYPDDFKKFLCDNFIGLDRPCSISMGIAYGTNIDALYDKLNNDNLNVMSTDKKESLDVNKILVGEKGIETPILAPREALELAVQIHDVLKDSDAIRGFALPKTVESLCYTSAFADSRINVAQELEVNSKSDELIAMLQEKNLTVDEFISNQLKEGMEYPEINAAENTEKNFCKSLYRGGTLGSNPYAVVSSMKAKDCAYATPDMSLAKYYSTGLEAGYDRAKVDGLFVEYGFIYEFEAKENQHYFCNYGIENGEDFSKGDNQYTEDKLETLYETPVFAHQNPLKGIYLVANGKVVKITNDKGEYLNKDWENFAQLHETHVRKGSSLEKQYNEEKICSILPRKKQSEPKSMASINSNMTPPPVQGYAGATPPPPPVQGYTGATPPPPPVQGYTGATPPPPPVQGYVGATPPPPPVQGYTGATPPPIEQTTQKFAEMNPQEQLNVILSMRKGTNPLLPKVTDVSSITNTQTKALSQTQKQSMSSIINSYSSRNR